MANLHVKKQGHMLHPRPTFPGVEGALGLSLFEKELCEPLLQ